jgi:hypothetical protein
MSQHLINHTVQDSVISQRASDGYIHATAMCDAAGKRWPDYFRLDSTKAYLKALSSDVQFPTSQLIISQKGNSVSFKQGTWVHPKVAIHLAQWLSPQFAVQVTNWVYDWMNGMNPGNTRTDSSGTNIQHRVRDEALNMVREILPALRQELLEGLRPMSRDISLHSLLGDVSTGQGRLLGVWEDLPAHHIQWPDKALAERHEYVVLGYWAETRLPTVMRLYAGNWIIASQLAVYLHPDFRFVAAFEADAPMV